MFLQMAMAYAVFIGALVSPGPDFLIVLRNALGFSVRSGVFTAIGITLGNTIHIAYCIAGIGLLISQSVLLFSLVKGAGAAYLAYVGICLLKSKGVTLDAGLETANGRVIKSDFQSFRSGFITNITNPKATMFFLALFSQMIDPSLPLAVQITWGALCLATCLLWFSLVAVIMGHARVRRAYIRASKGIDRVFGVFFIALAAKLALSRLD